MGFVPPSLSLPPKFSYNTRLATKCHRLMNTHTRFFLSSITSVRNTCVQPCTRLSLEKIKFMSKSRLRWAMTEHRNTPNRDRGQDKTHRRPTSTQTERGNIAVAHLKNTHMSVEFVAKHQVCEQSFAPLLRFRRNRSTVIGQTTANTRENVMNAKKKFPANTRWRCKLYNFSFVIFVCYVIFLSLYTCI